MTFNSSSACHAIKPCLGIRKAITKSIHAGFMVIISSTSVFLSKIYILLHLHLALGNFNLLKFL